MRYGVLYIHHPKIMYSLHASKGSAPVPSFMLNLQQYFTK